MTLKPGARIGPYEVVSAIGAGGMGEVYRANDARLKRHVAIKVLPSAVASDPERLARFQREAEVLAALNHPRIASIYGFEDADGVKALVMELVDGATLADRIAQGSMPVDEALAIAKQIAEAVEAAHAQGIVHRDLKPANIKVRPDGSVKVLDFGLAKALGLDVASGSDGSQSPTITTPAATRTGVILGTAAYMSPEQARGRPLDTRTDIWSFGCVLYEMLCARRPFAGEDVSDVLASILAREPDFTRLPRDTPASIRRLLRRCLHKDRHERLRDIGDARIEIQDALSHPDAEPTIAAIAPNRNRERVMWAAALLVVALAAVVLMMRPEPPRAEPAEMRVDIELPPNTIPLSLALSPDGRTIAFVVAADGRTRLWLHSLEAGVSRALDGTDGGTFPFWSPDNRNIGFFADGRLKRIDVDGGSLQTVALAGPTRSGTGAWNQDDVILFVSLGGPIARVSAGGGEPTGLSGLVQQGSDFAIQFLPGGRRFLYYVRGTPEARGVYAGSLDTPLEPRRLLDSESGAVYAPSGHLFYVRQRTLFAQPFDPTTLTVAGQPVRVADNVASSTSRAGVSVANTGAILLRRRTGDRQVQLAWFDREGKQIATVGAPRLGMSSPSLSLDGERVAFYGGLSGNNPDIWSLEIRRGLAAKVTSDLADDTGPIWSPDGSHIIFTSNRGGAVAIYEKSTTTDAPERPLVQGPYSPTDWSRDGRYVIFNVQDPRTRFDIAAIRLGDGSAPFPVVQTSSEEQNAQFSPNRQWIAYQSDESGRDEIYLQQFPAGREVLVSDNGGTQARWRPDGSELFYVGLDDRLMAVPIRFGPDENTAEVGTPSPLFTAPLGGAVLQSDFRPQYMVAPDGKRFLIAAVTRLPEAPATLILNWKPGLTR